MLRNLRLFLAIALASCATVTPALAQSVLLGNGTCAAPSLRFNSATTTGLARPSAGDTICVSTGGVARTWVDSAGIKLLNGSMTRPSIAFKSALGSGFYSIDANTFAVALNGDNPLRFSTNGGNPQLRAASGNVGAPAYSFISSTGLGLYRFGADTLGVATGGVHSLNISGGANARLTGGAGNMTIIPGTGNSRSLQLFSTDGSGAIQTGLNINGGNTPSVQATVPFRAADGSAAAPSYTLSNSTGTGLYRFGADTIGFAVAGRSTMYMVDDNSAARGLRGNINVCCVYGFMGTATGWGGNATTLTGYIGGSGVHTFSSTQYQAPTGSSTSPGVTTNSDNNTGLWWVGSDTLGTVVGGARSLSVAGGAATSLIGGAGNMTVTAGTGNSRTMTLQTTNSAGTALNTVAIGADSSSTFLGRIRTSSGGTATNPSIQFSGFNSIGMGAASGGNDTLFFGHASHGRFLNLIATASGTGTISGGAGNMTVQAGIGASRTMTLQTTTSGSVAKNTLVLGADSTATFLGRVRARGDATFPAFAFNGDNSSGLNSAGTNKPEMIVGGSTVQRWNDSQALFPNGTAARPAVTFSIDSTAGMWWTNNANEDTVHIGANGVAGLRAKRDTAIIANKAKAPTLTAASGTPNTVCINATTKELTENAATNCTVSAARFKTDIRPLSPEFATKSIAAMRPSSWTYIDGGRKALGLIADNLDSINTRLGFRNPDGQINSYDQAGVIGLLVAEVQNLRRELDSLKALSKKP